MSLGAEVFLIALGGSLGSILRGWLSERFVGLMPWVTLFINVTGSFAAGWINSWTATRPEAGWVHVLGAVGFCGGYTTFSTMALQALVMWRDRRSGWMAIYLALSLVIGITAAWAGMVMGRG